MVLSEEGLVATRTVYTGKWQLVTGDRPITEGLHCWDVDVFCGPLSACAFCPCCA